MNDDYCFLENDFWSLPDKSWNRQTKVCTPVFFSESKINIGIDKLKFVRLFSNKL